MPEVLAPRCERCTGAGLVKGNWYWELAPWGIKAADVRKRIRELEALAAQDERTTSYREAKAMRLALKPVHCNTCTWSGKCSTEGRAKYERTVCSAYTKRKIKFKVSARLAFSVYKFAASGMNYAVISRGGYAFGILTDNDTYAREYQAYYKLRKSAERVLERRIGKL